MAPPAPTVRGTPAGIRLDDGFPTKITIGDLTTVSFWEKTVKPTGIDGGDSVPTTTMHNVTWRTMNPRKLKTLTESTSKVAYDPNIYNQVVPYINLKTTITITFPDGSTLAFFGYLKNFEPDEVQEGTQPEATVTLVPTNQDPQTGVEAAPVLTSVSGT